MHPIWAGQATGLKYGHLQDNFKSVLEKRGCHKRAAPFSCALFFHLPDYLPADLHIDWYIDTTGFINLSG